MAKPTVAEQAHQNAMEDTDTSTDPRIRKAAARLQDALQKDYALEAAVVELGKQYKAGDIDEGTFRRRSQR